MHGLKVALLARTFGGPCSKHSEAMSPQGKMNVGKCDLGGIALTERLERPVKRRAIGTFEITELDKLHRSASGTKLYPGVQLRSPSRDKFRVLQRGGRDGSGKDLAANDERGCRQRADDERYSEQTIQLPSHAKNDLVVPAMILVGGPRSPSGLRETVE